MPILSAAAPPLNVGSTVLLLLCNISLPPQHAAWGCEAHKKNLINLTRLPCLTLTILPILPLYRGALLCDIELNSSWNFSSVAAWSDIVFLMFQRIFFPALLLAFSAATDMSFMSSLNVVSVSSADFETISLNPRTSIFCLNHLHDTPWIYPHVWLFHRSKELCFLLMRTPLLVVSGLIIVLLYSSSVLLICLECHYMIFRSWYKEQMRCNYLYVMILRDSLGGYKHIW